MIGDSPGMATAGLRRPRARAGAVPGLVYNQAGEEARVVTIGGVAHYAIPEDGFLRHVEAYHVDESAHCNAGDDDHHAR